MKYYRKLYKNGRTNCKNHKLGSNRNDSCECSSRNSETYFRIVVNFLKKLIYGFKYRKTETAECTGR